MSAVRPPRSPLRINVGCGHELLDGFLNIDIRPVPGLDLRASVFRLPFGDGTVAEARAGSLLEHFDNPAPALDELHRVVAADGALIVRVPALGTNAAHLDPTHRYLADLAHWRDLVLGYFGRVRLGSVGVRYRSNRLLVALQRAMIVGLGFHDLGQCWVLTATRKRPRPRRGFEPWWASLPTARSAEPATG